MTTRSRRSSFSEDETVPLLSRLTKEDRTPWYRKRNLRLLYLVMIPTCLGTEMTSGFDSSMMNGLQAVEAWNRFYGHPRSTMLGIMTALYSLGGVCALPFVAPISDTLGRRRSIVFGSVLMVIGALLQASSQNFTMFITARFILGFGIPFAVIAASSLVGELSHPKERPILSSLFSSSYHIGSFSAAAVTLCTFAIANNWAWRIPSLLQLTPSVLQIAFIHYLPESPRWLVAKRRHADALAILTKYHAEGDAENEFVRMEYAEIRETLELDAKSSKSSWSDMVATRGMRRRVLIAVFLGIATQWSGNGLISYFLAPILDSIGIHDNRTKNLINLATVCWAFVNGTTIALTIPRIRRRVAYMICTISLFCIFTAWTFAGAIYTITGSILAGHAVVALMFLYSPAYNIGYNALSYTFMIEVFPYHVRSKGLTIFQTGSKSAVFLNQFVNPIGIANAGWKYYISYCVFLLFEIVFVYFLFPETAGRTLEELAFLYEGDEIRHEQEGDIEDEIHHGYSYSRVPVASPSGGEGSGSGAL
ncbi:general substrate transporter [Gloeophyllum trabeum ATCC 11539]|uniref:General substrate transporter n=1 Tax=Gloeophyllum trabeum (strain ATCC 11539 / FP-39264 / Madison 617) TaxID=670483 RepID=S7RVR5_GLOTA|nr:general substrate transporter [Gloeophyllum trabeum ATCC 11539]EPQ58905.1 general substrate transporter [Gloeophyllum trabeum ATCC 11539]